jgi:hypothetical protein
MADGLEVMIRSLGESERGDSIFVSGMTDSGRKEDVRSSGSIQIQRVQCPSAGHIEGTVLERRGGGGCCATVGVHFFSFWENAVGKFLNEYQKVGFIGLLRKAKSR